LFKSYSDIIEQEKLSPTSVAKHTPKTYRNVIHFSTLCSVDFLDMYLYHKKKKREMKNAIHEEIANGVVLENDD
jgi:hypothetical protein